MGPGGPGPRPGRPEQAGSADVLSVSCGPAGDCAAGGDYTDGSGHRQGFVVSERNGVWGRATPVPGLATLNQGQGQGVGAQVGALSCASAGNCSAGGYYSVRGNRVQAFVVSQRNGKWGRAAGVPGLAALNAGGTALVSSVSCAAAGNCTAGGYYTARRNHGHVIVAIERHGRWGRAAGVPGLGALNSGSGLGAGVTEVSCGSAGNCAAGGYLHRTRPSPAGVRGQPAEREMGPGDHGARHLDPGNTGDPRSRAIPDGRSRRSAPLRTRAPRARYGRPARH